MNTREIIQQLVISSILLLSFTLSAQEGYLRVDEIEGATMMSPYILGPDEQKIEGNPYLNTTWKEIKIVRVDGKKLLVPNAKYHIESEELITEVEGKLYRINNKEQIKSFELDDQSFVGLYYDQGKFGFFQHLSETDKIVLLKKHVCSLLKGQPTNGIMAATDDKYSQQKIEYYIKQVNKESEPLLLKVTNKKISLKSSEKYPDLAKYLDGIKGKFKDDESIIQIFQEFK